MTFLPGSDHPSWNGGRWIDSKGYVCVWVGRDHPCAIRGRSFCREHTLVFWQTRGRLPRRGFDVHHRNLNKQDNAPTNLQEKRKSHHSRYHLALLDDAEA